VTTSDYDAAEPIAGDEPVIADDAPTADALEQQAQVSTATDGALDLPVELPDDVDPADALDQARPVEAPDDER